MQKCKEMREETIRKQLQQFSGRSYRKKGSILFEIDLFDAEDFRVDKE